MVSLKPNITDLIFTLGLGEDLVGVTSYCQLPQNRNLDRIADYVHVDVERVMALKPTLVLGSEENSSKKEINFLHAKGIRVELFPFRTLAETRQSILKMALLLGKEERGRKIGADMDAALGKIKKEGSKKTLIVVGTNPLIVAGERTLLGDLLEWVGGKNAAAGSKLRYPIYSLEKLVASQPEVIVDLSMGTEGKSRDSEIYRRFPSLPAVQSNQIYFLDMNHFPASPGMVQGARELAKVLEK
ncbi:MAG: helical backbone metal receptor [Deltaproteobacteria bacterium]|nr:helical backbone metal receptor [Deltaproteobacteria bacterium]